MFKARDIRIVIDGGRNQTFYPGARINGQVTYKTLTNERLHSITIDLRGTEKVLSSKKSVFGNPEFIEVFHINEVLQRRPKWTEGKLLSWSFDMTLPLLTGPDRTNRDEFYGEDADNCLFTTSTHPLAPSMGKEHSQTARIEYQMYAVARFGNKIIGAGTEMAEASVADVIDSLNFAPDMPVDQQMVTKDLDFPLLQGKVRTRLLNTVRRGSLASLSDVRDTGTLIAKVPTRVILGENINVSLSLGTEGSQDSYLVKQSTLTIRSLTHCRQKNYAYRPDSVETKDIKLTADNSSRSLSSPALLRATTTKFEDLPPSFSSYSISRSYQLVVIATIACGKGKDRFETVVDFISDIALIRRVEESEINRRRQDNPPILEPISVPIEADVLPTYDMHESHALIGRGEAIDQEESLEALAMIRTLTRREA